MSKIGLGSFSNLFNVSAKKDSGLDAAPPAKSTSHSHGHSSSVGQHLGSIKNFGRNGFQHLLEKSPEKSPEQTFGKKAAREIMDAAPATLAQTMSAQSLGALSAMLADNDISGLTREAIGDGALRRTTTCLKSLADLPRYFAMRGKPMPPEIAYFAHSAERLLNTEMKPGASFQSMGTPQSYAVWPLATGFDADQVRLITTHLARIGELGQQFGAYQKSPQRFKLPEQTMGQADPGRSSPVLQRTASAEEIPVLAPRIAGEMPPPSAPGTFRVVNPDSLVPDEATAASPGLPPASRTTSLSAASTAPSSLASPAISDGVFSTASTASTPRSSISSAASTIRPSGVSPRSSVAMPPADSDAQTASGSVTEQQKRSPQTNGRRARPPRLAERLAQTK
ncbi:MAG: hypothetical protein ACRYGK_12195 [Janthinobacterium lividum]